MSPAVGVEIGCVVVADESVILCMCTLVLMAVNSLCVCTSIFFFALPICVLQSGREPFSCVS